MKKVQRVSEVIIWAPALCHPLSFQHVCLDTCSMDTSKGRVKELTLMNKNNVNLDEQIFFIGHSLTWFTAPSTILRTSGLPKRVFVWPSNSGLGT
eukprot:1161824-Pelagomonas_calceolata.AAC.12